MTTKTYLTSAPTDYDYHYVSTVRVVTDRYGKMARVVTTKDEGRFETYQKMRYGSGLHYCWEMGTDNAEYTLGGE